MSRRYRDYRAHSISYEIVVSSRLKTEISTVLRRHGLNDQADLVDEEVDRYGSKIITLQVDRWTAAAMTDMLPVLKDERKASAMLKAAIKIKTNPLKTKVGKLELLPEALLAYLTTDIIDGWLYRATQDKNHVAYVVRSINYHPAQDHGRDYVPAYVDMHLGFNRADYYTNKEREANVSETDCYLDTTVMFRYDDIVGRSVADVLTEKNYLHETPELKAAYEEELALYVRYTKRGYAQFLCTSMAESCKQDYWTRTEAIYGLLHGTKMVCEEPLLNRQLRLVCGNTAFEDYSPKGFSTVPLHCYLLFFDLTRHDHCWVHVRNCKPYVYDKTLRDKLVLPETHRSLIDTLCDDMDVFQDDIVEGKSGGTAILCYGAPGLGKTLTAEVYSEVVGRALYRVQAGQLGIAADTIESNLEMVLRRGERWGAVVLLDEADVYIRSRGDDLAHNAVVAAFLCKLEYFHGLLFMTTNRASDVDDAIVSRMIATFKYETPSKEMAFAIWKILSKQFGLAISDAAIEKLITVFPELSGRDIKQLLKLVIKYCRQKKQKLSIETFRTCAMFRGIV